MRTAIQLHAATGPLLETYSPALALVDLIRAYGARLDAPAKHQYIEQIVFWVTDAVRAIESQQQEETVRFTHGIETVPHNANRQFRLAVEKFGNAPDATGLVSEHCRSQIQRILFHLQDPMMASDWLAFRDAFRQSENYRPEFLLRVILDSFGDDRDLKRRTHMAIINEDEAGFKMALDQLLTTIEERDGTQDLQLRWAFDRIWNSIRHPISNSEWHLLLALSVKS